ncbi:hypothetical protein C8Q76DRAFT_800780 [Earliella scabrosa]|nr:hypothetical protein C8Q76DRAFT_800780 [Earliella scabrosa]
MTRHSSTRTPSHRRTRSSLARNAAAFLRSPTKTVDTKDVVRLRFKEFAKCLADLGTPCEPDSGCRDHPMLEKQLQYLTKTPDDGRYYVVCKDESCNKYNVPQFITKRLPAKWLKILARRRELYHTETTLIDEVDRLDRKLATHLVKLPQASRANGGRPSSSRVPDSESSDEHSASESTNDSDSESDDDFGDDHAGQSLFTPATVQARPGPPHCDTQPFWEIVAYTEDGKPPTSFEFPFPPGTTPVDMFAVFDLKPTDTVAYHCSRSQQWVYGRVRKLSFDTLLLNSGERLVWVKSGVKNCPRVKQLTGEHCSLPIMTPGLELETHDIFKA